MSFYVYLVSSLPTLHFGGPPPFSAQKFFQICQDLIAEEDLDILRQSADIGRDFVYAGKSEALKKWCAFNIALNNEMVKLRAQRRHVEPERFLRPESLFSADILHLANVAYRNPSLLEAELMLDAGRWNFLEELVVGHYFDLELLLIYLQKLLILERWEKIKAADKAQLLKAVLV